MESRKKLSVINVLCIIFCVSAFSPCFAQDSVSSTASSITKPILHEVLFQTQSENWINSKSAKVIININALINENQLANAHADILIKLQQLAKSDWHITQFDRTPTESGLEQLQTIAETRLSEDSLSAIRAQAKKMSKPGETFTVDSIAFEPTLTDIESAKKQLRENIYQNINSEITNLNKIYPGQHYVVHKIDFTENNIVQPTPMGGKVMMAMSKNSVSNIPVTVANKLTLSANVVLASVDK